MAQYDTAVYVKGGRERVFTSRELANMGVNTPEKLGWTPKALGKELLERTAPVKHKRSIDYKSDQLAQAEALCNRQSKEWIEKFFEGDSRQQFTDLRDKLLENAND